MFEKAIPQGGPLEDRLRSASYLIGEATSDLDAIVAGKDVPYVDTIENWNKAKSRGYKGRKFNMGDAKMLANRANRLLREAWDILDPPLKGSL